VTGGVAPQQVLEARQADLVALVSGFTPVTRKGAAHWALCPFHREGTPSFKIEAGRYFCFGCGQKGDAISFVRRVEAVGFRDAVERLATIGHPRSSAGPRQMISLLPDDGLRAGRALAIWHQTADLPGSPGWEYLRMRGVDLDALPSSIVQCLRWHNRCPWEGSRHGALVALYTDIATGEPRAIHRTAVTRDGRKVGRKVLGPKKGCVIRLWPDDFVTHGLTVGEGIETVLAAATNIKHRGTLLRPAWAAGDAANLATLPVLNGIDALTILVDHDASGTGQKAAAQCATRWTNAGCEVARLIPRTVGADFADIAGGAP
jgi:hypothetical protein